MTSLSMAEEVEMTEVERLRAAAAKAREEYERLSKVRYSYRIYWCIHFCLLHLNHHFHVVKSLTKK